MPLLNPPDVLPEAMRFLLRALFANPSARCSREDLVTLVAPEGLAEAMASIGAGADVEGASEGEDVRTGGRTIADRSLDALVRLGLVSVEDQLVEATPLAVTSWRAPGDITAQRFAIAARKALFATALANADPSESGVADLTEGAALLVSAPDPLQFFDGFDQRTSKRRFVDYQRHRCGDTQSGWPVGNRERWVAFRRLVVYLGLGRPVGSSGLLADASAALADDLGHLAPDRLDVGAFVERCATALPILDGGSLQAEDEERPAKDISPGLSLTLRQLEAQGLLRFDRESDAPTRVVAIGSAPTTRQEVTHIHWFGSQVAA